MYFIYEYVWVVIFVVIFVVILGLYCSQFICGLSIEELCVRSVGGECIGLWFLL